MSVRAAIDSNGISFTTCDLVVAAHAKARAQARPAAKGKAPARNAERRGEASTKSRRREVVIGGRRVKTIDVHAHCVIPEASRCWD